MKKPVILVLSSLLTLGYTSYDTALEVDDGAGVTEPVVEEMFIHEDQTAFTVTDTYAKDSPYEDGEDVLYIGRLTELSLTGTNNCDYWEITVDDEIYYINNDDIIILTEEYAAIEEMAYITEEVAGKDSPSDEGEDVVTLDQYSIVTLTGINTSDYWQVTIDEEVYYVNKASMLVLTEDYTEVEQKGYIIANTYGKDSPSEDGSNSKYLPKYTTVTVTGINNSDYWQIEYGGNTYYVDIEDVTVDKDVFDALVAKTYNTSWKGKKLTKKAGRIDGPSGEETYYNLDMSKVVATMRKLGNTDAYWVRSDGCKMLGDYIIVAANLSVHPRGSLVETSLGTGIVCDTGGFASVNTTQIDIATNW